MTEYNQRCILAQKKTRDRRDQEVEQEKQATLLEQIQGSFRIYFPTKETVLGSKGGPRVSLLLSNHTAGIMIQIVVRRDHLLLIKVVQRADVSSRIDARLQERT